MLACAPSDVSHLKQELLIESILSSGASSVFVIPEPFAAACAVRLGCASMRWEIVPVSGERKEENHFTEEEAEELFRTHGVAHSRIERQSATGAEQGMHAVAEVVKKLTTEASSFLRWVKSSFYCN